MLLNCDLGESFGSWTMGLDDQGRVVRLDELIEKGLLGLVAFVGNIAKAIPALCQHADCASAIHCSK